MKIKLFYFKNRNEQKNFIEKLSKYFTKNNGEFIYINDDRKTMFIYEGEIEGGFDSYIINSIEEILKILKSYEFETFAVRSRRKNKMDDNKMLGKIIVEGLNKKVNLENPDLTIFLDSVDGFTLTYVELKSIYKS